MTVIRLQVFLLGFWEGAGEMGMTYPETELSLNERYDRGRALRRFSRHH